MSPTRRDVLKWGAGAGTLAATGAVSFGLPTAASAAVTPGGAYTNMWMSHLNPSTPLNMLTIPGTHDSCCEYPSHGTEWSHTQNWGIPEQLQQGIRFLDIRCNGLQGTANELGIYHSSYYQYIRFQDVLDQCQAFLRAQPTECIVMRVRNENAGGQALNDTEFARRVNYYRALPAYQNLLKPLKFQWPTLSSAAGQIVPIFDFIDDNNIPPTMGSVIPWGGGTSPWVQSIEDHYYVDMDPKGRYIVQQFDRAAADVKQGTLYINFLSMAGAPLSQFPKVYEQKLMDNYIYPYLNTHRKGPRFGIVPMDFPDFHVNVVQMLIDRNL
ncbi:phosphatidylinositol-specific phospholipase C domain-containing protein [Catenulispora sp. NF23]|uniref:1-phosphatidylinositol phosphodiesterase n=1 Tax=Catenulispora pinistramenti TaxID=2705254 RepID=A0ABS5L1D2_9ACTN|nr:phosphatidylinositol-specific phospholipase C domain-containing protein [Catenulispora pinistramenti]MBS2535782.1 phosphatidylinositol-specific phospholipase C domain-containing protein [Catenulispora pinistramenti]MBS2552129.1 phosphatidylinositol-specific phospholipase C domain-containing protein [Catenulispora pinistramenti]